MATDPVALMALDTASQSAIAPYTPPDGLDLNPYMTPTTSLFETIQNQLSWVPQNLASIAAQVFAAGAFPRLRNFNGYSAAQLPSWLQLPANLQAWQQVITQYQPIENAFIARSAHRTWLSRVYSSRIVSIFNVPPRTVASAMKSHVQTWFRCVAVVGNPVETPRRITFRFVGGTRSPSSRRRRWMCRLPTRQPSRRSKAAILRYP